MKACQISVVVPCFNESDVLEAFHAALIAVLVPTRQSFEICYVDDGSSDGTPMRLTALAEADRRVRYTSFSRNFGKEAAMLAGLRMTRGDVVVLMDADLQHPPELLPRMLELRRRGYDQVVARRDRRGEGVLRAAVSAAYYRAMGHCMDVAVVDGAGDFRLLSRRAVDSVLALPESNRFSKGIFSWIGFATVSFTYENIPRAAGKSKWGGRNLLNYGIDGVISFNSRPLRLAIYAGLSLFLAAVAYALWVVLRAALHGADVPGYTSLLTAMVALSGIQLITLGVIGEYVGRTYHEAKNRPHYVVRATSETHAGLPAGLPASVPSSSAIGRDRPRSVRQFAVFAVIGLVNTAVYLAVYASLNRWIPYLTAHVLGYTVSVVGSFLLNSYITCRTKPTWRAFVRYPLSSLSGLVAAGGLLYLAVSVLGVNKNVAALGAGVLVTPLSFLLARWAITSGAVASSPYAPTSANPPGLPADEPDTVRQRD
ncbi:glycosyltransferase [Streptomyces sp. NPDC059092]|uniref:glycosyltransferase n=1 Tax=Streptomyces sp. NPDC059092 TaxID=3346725 RepID=UPI0036C6A210